MRGERGDSRKLNGEIEVCIDSSWRGYAARVLEDVL